VVEGAEVEVVGQDIQADPVWAVDTKRRILSMERQRTVDPRSSMGTEGAGMSRGAR
jgi:hypothetical protein